MQRPDSQTMQRHREIPHPDVMLIEQQRSLSWVSAQLVHYNFLEPPDNLFYGGDTYRLDYSLGVRPKNSRACYETFWPSNRFERVGNVFLVPPKQVLHGKSDEPGTSSALVFEVQAPRVHQWVDRELCWSPAKLAAALDLRDRRLQVLVLRIGEEIRHPGFASEMLLELLIGQLSIELARCCVGLRDQYRANGLSAARLRQIEERLQAPGSAPTVTELAGLCQISERQLARGFKASRGCSIGAYVARQQIERAKTMLDSDDPIKAIAYNLGFSSSSSFCYAFRKATGISPRQYREKVLRERCRFSSANGAHAL